MKEKENGMEKELTLVVMAAGMGSRFGGLKQAEPVTEHGSAILDFSVYDAMQAGFDRVVFVIKHAIEEDFKRLVGDRIAKRIPVTYVYQELDVLPEGYSAPDGRTKPWGTGHAVLCTKPVVNGPFAVINADDYYGRHAFTEMAQYLKTNPSDYCMTGFRLKNTLSENGSVSRGVCEVKDGNLVRVVEHTNIRDCQFSEDDGKTWKKLDENTVVSMNLWGFTTAFYDSLEKDFRAFLDEHGQEEKAEFYLPSAVQNVIDSHEKNVRVFVAEDQWYGVTYREDRESVSKALTAMIENGDYPSEF